MPEPSSQTFEKIEELSAVMPAYNEEEILPLALDEAVRALDAICQQWELIVVDDGSTDSTPRLLEDWSGREARVRVLRQPRNLGYAKALIRGFDAARYEAIFYTDADAQFDLGEIVNLYPHLKSVDMVVGYRKRRRDPGIRRVTSGVYNRMQSLVLGVRGVRDVNCAFKLFRKSFFERVRLSSEGFVIDAELFARARRAGLSWREVGVTHRPRQEGSTTVRVRAVTVTLRQLWALKRAVDKN